MNKDIYKKINKKAQNREFKWYSKELCPDQVVAQIEYTGNDIKFIQLCRTKSNSVVNKSEGGIKIANRIEVTKSKVLNNVVVIVLESPHRDEYDANGKAIGPAFGITGNNINKFLPDVLMSAINRNVLTLNKGTYDIVLLNAVQKQCSLGEETKKYRDAMFLKYWEKDKIRDSFRNRLNNVLLKTSKQNDIVINCCTQGNHNINNKFIKKLGLNLKVAKDSSLKDLVSTEMHSVISTFYLCEHPACWNIPYIK